MSELLSALVLLSTMSLIQAAEVPHPISSTMVKIGDSASFYCPVTDEVTYFYWYKQSLGRQMQTVAETVYGNTNIKNQFEFLHFNITRNEGQYIFTIRKIRKEDEAMYFCQSGPSHGMTLLNSTFIAVNDQTNQQNFISVEQNPPAASVQRGHSVSLQCSLLSEDKEKPVQCPGEHNVYWFRAGSGGYGPGIIYTHKNKTEEQDKRKCIYRLSTTVQDSSDSGTYYCAVATCGQILFGGGTKVETEPENDPVVIALGVLLAFCVTVIVVLCVLLSRSRVCEHCKNAISHLDHDRRTGSQSEDLDGGAVDVNYSTLTFSARTKQGNQKKREQDCVYSAVRDYHTHPNQSAL
ncbi:uncharacterized protein LOC115427378 [Sphaeramia orbicularis]|uniref:uncharacterized protein LOC115427378 n=1 Tax=Sphaeramia orbicularis TaxID=375764 RepID=UPI00117CF920|nr:uncharacterized protein LOC115427378 [Sphaeramia orbicularis]